MGGNSSLNLDQIKRALTDLVSELHARKLAIPAGAVLVAIVAAIFVLPKTSTPPPPTTSAPVADTSKAITSENVVALKLVGVTSLDNDIPMTNSTDPFNGKASSECRQIPGVKPKEFLCLVGDTYIRFFCQPGFTEGLCGDSATGATGGSSSGTGGSSNSTGGSTGGGDAPKKKKKKKKAPETYYVVDVNVDGRSFNDVIAGEGLPDEKSALAIYAGTNSSSKKAIFIAGDGATVTGVEVDSELGNFELSPGQTVTITDKLAAQHTLSLKSIAKVTK